MESSVQQHHRPAKRIKMLSLPELQARQLHPHENSKLYFTSREQRPPLPENLDLPNDQPVLSSISHKRLYSSFAHASYA